MENTFCTNVITTIIIFSAQNMIQAFNLWASDANQQFRKSNFEWNKAMKLASQFSQQENFLKREEEIRNEAEQTFVDYPMYLEDDLDLQENYVYSNTDNNLENPIKRKPALKRKRYEFTARVFNVNFSTSLENAFEKNGKQIELSNKITIPNLSSAQLEYKSSVRDSREQFYEMTFTNSLTQFRRVYFEFYPSFFPFLGNSTNHLENYEEPRLEGQRKIQTVRVKEYQMEATVIVPPQKCVEVSFLLDWIDNFHTKFNSIMEISGVMFKNSRKGTLIQVPLTPELTEKILKNKGIAFAKPRKDEYVSNGKSLYVRLSGELRATFGTTAYMSAVDIPCQSFNKTSSVTSTEPPLNHH